MLIFKKRGYSFQKFIYRYLANNQNTLFAVVPVHTKEEILLYDKPISTHKKDLYVNINSSIPDFDSFAKIWSSFADGVKIFYKTPEHLKLYFNKRLEAGVFYNTILLNENIHNNIRDALLQSNRITTPIASIKAPTPIEHYSGHQRRLLPNDHSSLTIQRHERQLIPSPAPIAISPPIVSALTINNTPSALLLPRDQPPTDVSPTDVNPRPKKIKRSSRTCFVCMDTVSCSGRSKPKLCINKCGLCNIDNCPGRYRSIPCPFINNP